MFKEDLNKEWAELEGWEFKEHDHEEAHCIKHTEKEEYICLPYAKWQAPDEETPRYNSVPDYTEPNRFFDEVVPRMVELGFIPRAAYNDKRERWEWLWRRWDKPNNETWHGVGVEKGCDIGSSGLSTAIKVRRELNV